MLEHMCLLNPALLRKDALLFSILEAWSFLSISHTRREELSNGNGTYFTVVFSGQIANFFILDAQNFIESLRECQAVSIIMVCVIEFRKSLVEYISSNFGNNVETSGISHSAA